MQNQKHIRPIVSRLKRVEREQAVRRKKNRIFSYNTGGRLHEKQLAFHRCEKRNRWVFGGNRSGKTECGAVETVYLARGIHPYRANGRATDGWVVSLSRDVQREVAQRKILAYLNPDWIENIVMLSGRVGNPLSGVIDHITVRHVSGGLSTIGFKSCEMGRDKFQGASLDYVWFDEEPPEDVYEECVMRVLDRRGDIFGTMTPLLGLTFVYNRIYLNDRADDEVWHIHMEWADNPFLDPREIERLTAGLSEDALRARRFGQFEAGAGLVYPEFDERVHVIAPFDVPKAWYDMLSIDPGLNNPTSCHFYAVDYDGNVYVLAEHYESGQPACYHAEAIKRIAAALDWHGDGKGRIAALIDSAAGQRTLAAEKSVAELFYEQGILVNPRVNKDLYSGISRVKAYLKPLSGPPKLYIFSTCKALIKEFKAYWWGSGDTPRKCNDHALDELRYYLMSRPEPARMDRTDISEIQKHKARLLRRARAKIKQTR